MGTCDVFVWVVIKIIVPFLDPYYNTAPSIQGTQKEIILLTSAHISLGFGV